ncbi:hypothetical protein RFG22_08355 [Streptococcus ruminantium]|nr:DUF6572 domain-containing protein [Streptococcus ruminantium]MDQ8767704.1 hypothetical protein [Streptococcus ruminantium]MDQ8780759.1 hypothetical protein [Streptococcus ruminantium]
MAVDNFDIIDVMGKNKDGHLVLMIADYLDWMDEECHLLILQNKLNRYLDFIQNEEYREYYDIDFTQIIIDIHFKFGWTENCKKYLKYVVEVTKPLGIVIRMDRE